MASTLRGTDRPLAELYDVALLDLDGVVYVGQQAVPGAPEALRAARQQGMQLAFVTNNAARPPVAVAGHLTELGVAAEQEEVITSSQAAARWLADRLPAGALVLVLGTAGLYDALHERGLTTTDTADQAVRAVVQGYSPEMNWQLLAEGAVAINAGATWVATNADPTVPSPRGPLPGNGSLVAAMRLATRKQPVVTGKPDPTMHRETLIRTGAKHPIVVGDRLDTDIEGANAVGCDSLLVFSGVTDAAGLLAAPADLRPTYIGADVSALLTPQPGVDIGEGGAACGRWQATRLSDSGWELSSIAGREPAGDAKDDTKVWDDDTLDALRALCAARWSSAGPSGSVDSTTVTGVEGAARSAIERLGLTAS